MIPIISSFIYSAIAFSTSGSISISLVFNLKLVLGIMCYVFDVGRYNAIADPWLELARAMALAF